MMYCPKCGKENKVNAKICIHCNYSLSAALNHGFLSSGKVPYSEDVDSFGRGYQKFEGEIPKRNYLKYVFATYFGPTIILVPAIYLIAVNQIEVGTEKETVDWFTPVYIFGVVLSLVGFIIILRYYYLNFKDYQNMVNKFHPASYPRPQNPWLMVVILLGFSSIALFFKYSQLRSHLKETHKQTNDLSPSPWAVVSLGVIPIIAVIVSIVTGVLFGINIVILYLTSTLVILATSFYFERDWQLKFNRHLDLHYSN